MKKPYLLLFIAIIAIFTTPSYSQKRADAEIEVADKYYENGEFYLAADYYDRALKNDNDNYYLNFRLAECYRLYFDYSKAEKQYKMAGKLGADKEYPLVRFWYAMMLKSNGKYQRSVGEFDKFLARYSPEIAEDTIYVMEAKLEQEGCLLAMNELKKPLRDYKFELLPSPVNSEFSEYAPAFYENDSSIILASSREGTKGNEIDVRLGGQYTDIFRFKKVGKRWTVYDDKDNFSVVNTVRNDGAGEFSVDLSKFYYTSCLEDEYPCAIYVTKLVDGKWTEGVRLNDNINTRSFETKQPSLTTSGDTIFYVTDRPDGYGYNDIWYSVKNGPGEDWGPGKNMGPIVNTPFLDMSPQFYEEANVLFFVSNGHQGFGGLDIFEYFIGSDLEPRNLGLPFNSNRDDFYFHLGKKKGVMASNREGGKGSDDIYYYNIESREIIIAKVNSDSLAYLDVFKVLATLTYSESGEPAQEVTILLTDEVGNLIKSAQTDQYGQVEFDDLSSTKSYKVMLEEERDDLSSTVFYSGAGGDIDLSETRQGKVLAVILRDQLQKIGKFAILSTIVSATSGDPAINVPILLVDDDGNVLKRTTTDHLGMVRFENLDSDRNYNIIVDEDFLSLISDVKYVNGETKLIWVKGEPVQGATVFENIYFDFNDYRIRREAEMTLDELATYLKDNSDAKVEISANSDAIGGEDYNKNLSQKRGEEVEKYLESRGAKPSSLVINAMGESQPIGNNKSNVGRMLNRRAEFKVSGGHKYETLVMTYVVESPTSLDNVAKLFNMPKEELIRINNLDKDMVDAMTPLRVRRTGDNGLIAPITMAAAEKTSTGSMLKTEQLSLPPLKKGQEYYVVEPLNTLYGIAKMHGMTVDELKSTNNISSNRLQIGWRLIVEPREIKYGQTSQGKYVVKEGDTMFDIAKKFGLTVSQLRNLNGLDSNLLFAGMVLKLNKDSN
jgi:LysM repeat protein/tetratricopeptide (TPR) repeat protein